MEYIPFPTLPDKDKSKLTRIIKKIYDTTEDFSAPRNTINSLINMIPQSWLEPTLYISIRTLSFENVIVLRPNKNNYILNRINADYSTDFVFTLFKAIPKGDIHCIQLNNHDRFNESLNLDEFPFCQIKFDGDYRGSELNYYRVAVSKYLKNISGTKYSVEFKKDIMKLGRYLKVLHEFYTDNDIGLIPSRSGETIRTIIDSHIRRYKDSIGSYKLDLLPNLSRTIRNYKSNVRKKDTLDWLTVSKVIDVLTEGYPELLYILLATGQDQLIPMSMQPIKST